MSGLRSGMGAAYRSEIDGMRAIAIVPVILFHAGFETFSGGYVGVDVFFVISGYLITRLILNDMERGTFSLLEFYERRARRILPALFVVTAVSTVFAYALMLPRQLEEYAQVLIGVFAFVANIVLWRQSGYFSLDAEEKPLLHTWSLSVEEQYYVIFPLFLILAFRFGRHPVFWLTALAAAFSLALAEWGSRYEPHANFFLLPTRAWEMLIGSLCAMAGAGAVLRLPQVAREGLSALGLAMIGFAIFVFDSTTPFPSLYTLVPTLGAALVILFAADSFVGRLLSLRLIVGIGLVSYSAYLWHQPMFAYLRIYFGGEVARPILVIAGIATFALAILTWRFVEQPMRNRRTGPIRRRSTVFAASGAVMAGFVALSVITVMGEGFSGRLSDETRGRIAALDALKAARTEGIEAGRCHFNSNAEGADPKTFIANWDCRPAGEGGAIAVFGDSHAADKAHALRTAGIDVLQVTGNGCSINPGIGGRPRCQKLLEAFLEFAAEAGVETVLVTGLMGQNELRPAYLSKTLDFWAERFETVIALSPMPLYSHFEAVFVAKGPGGVGDIEAKTHDTERFLAAIKTLDVPDNVALVDVRDLICAPGGFCKAEKNGAPLLVDEGHLSRAGAKVFGERLAERLSEMDV